MRIWMIALAATLGCTFPADAATRSACPTEIEPLVTAMLRDLPGYANRILARSSTRQLRSSIITAGRPEFEPLPLSDSKPDPTLRQAFATTLEREIVAGKITDLQQFHWMFLTRSDRGWQLALLFTRIGATPGQPTTPPRESSQGVIGQAVQAWLSDCNTRGIRVDRNRSNPRSSKG